MVLISGVSAIVLDVCGVEVFWERGVMVLLFLLVTVEWYTFMTLYGYSKPYGTNFLDDCIPTGRKVRIAVYNVYSIVLLFGSMIVGMFMKDNEHAKTKVLVVLCLYLVMDIFRADAVRWVRFNEFNKTPRRSMWANAEQLKQQ
jgi:predicted ABC-type exoprotein transport system permease subunit